MSQKPTRRERIMEEMEACRPGSSPASEPALAHLTAALAGDLRLEELHDRLQQIDLRLAAAMHDVPVPAGLADRLIQQLVQPCGNRSPLPTSLRSVPEEEQGVRDRVDVTACVLYQVPGEDVIAATHVEPHPHNTRSLRLHYISRRWLLAGMVSLSAAATLLVAVLIGVYSRHSYTNSTVLEKAIEFFSAELADAGRTDSPPSDYPFSRDLVRMASVRWRPISDFLGCSGVAYDLSVPGGSHAMLYVVDCQVHDAPAVPPITPAFTTANCSTAAWQDGGLLYVLVVSGGPESYRRYLKPIEAV